MKPRRTRVLRVDASGRNYGSHSRALADGFIDRLLASGLEIEVTKRDLADPPLPQIDDRWIKATNTPDADRTAADRDTLSLSDTLVEQLRDADLLVIAAPIYNFGMPAPLKAWFDLVCRARLTFRYGPNGPEGLLQGKSAVVLVTSGGTAVGGPIDFATPHLKHLLGFIGIEQIALVAADRLFVAGSDGRANAAAELARIAAELGSALRADEPEREVRA